MLASILCYRITTKRNVANPNRKPHSTIKAAVGDLAGAATVEVVFDVGVATLDAVFEFAGAATFDVAVAFEVAAAVVFEAAVDVPRHGALPNFLVIIRNRRETCLSAASWFLDPNNG